MSGPSESLFAVSTFETNFGCLTDWEMSFFILVLVEVKRLELGSLFEIAEMIKSIWKSYGRGIQDFGLIKSNLVIF